MRKLSYYIVLFICSLGLASCAESFELNRPPEKQWTSTATLEGGLSTCYWNLEWTSRGFIEYFDFLLSGSAYLIPGQNQHPYAYRRDFSQTIAESNNYWGPFYQTITLANLAIEQDLATSGNPFNLAVNGDDYKNNYKRQIGEYYFIRGNAYYLLAKWFAPPYNGNSSNTKGWIPLKTNAANSMEDVQTEKLGTLEEIYSQIISDLKKAKEILPEKFTLTDWTTKSPGYECGRANKFVAAALLGKIYFHMGKYAEAKAEFDYVINSNVYKLSARPCDPFINNRPDKTSSEVIWEFNSGDVTITPQEQHNKYWYPALIYGFRFRDSNGSFYDNLPQSGSSVQAIQISGWGAYTIGPKSLIKMGWINSADSTVTDQAKADLRFTGDNTKIYHTLGAYRAGIKKGTPEYLMYESRNKTLTSRTNVFIDKFFRGADAPYGKYSKVPYIRLPELLLLRSWINWKNGAKDQAADDANKVWNRSNPFNINKFSSSNIDQDGIYTEFMRELIGEGFQVPFLLGTGMSIPQGEESGIIPVNAPYSSWFWPIPPAEAALNPNYK